MASSSRAGTVNASSAGTTAARPVPSSRNVSLDLRWRARPAAARIGIQLVSRVNERTTRQATHAGSQRGPRSSTSRPAARAPISSARPQRVGEREARVVAERGQRDGRERHGGRDRQPEAHEEEQEQGQDRGHVAGDGDVEDGPVAGGGLERGCRQRDRDPALVELGVVGDPVRVTGVGRVAAPQLCAERPLERFPEGVRVVVSAQLERARLVEQPVGRPLDRVGAGRRLSCRRRARRAPPRQAGWERLCASPRSSRAMPGREPPGRLAFGGARMGYFRPRELAARQPSSFT